MDLVGFILFVCSSELALLTAMLWEGIMAQKCSVSQYEAEGRSHKEKGGSLGQNFITEKPQSSIMGDNL